MNSDTAFGSRLSLPWLSRGQLARVMELRLLLRAMRWLFGAEEDCGAYPPDRPLFWASTSKGKKTKRPRASVSASAVPCREDTIRASGPYANDWRTKSMDRLSGTVAAWAARCQCPDGAPSPAEVVEQKVRRAMLGVKRKESPRA